MRTLLLTVKRQNIRTQGGGKGVKNVLYEWSLMYIYTTTHLSLIYDYSYIRLDEPWGCLTSANVRLE